MGETGRQQWEYRIEYSYVDETVLACLGDNGWELVAIAPHRDRWVFKRPARAKTGAGE